MITALCGGVGGAKLTLGLYRTLPPDSLAVVVNTADDLEFAGLHISPDLDTVMYTLAGLAHSDVGWGIAGDTFQALEMFGRYGLPTWFRIGDRDLATDVVRSDLMRSGASLTRATEQLTTLLEVRARVLPMTDAAVSTRLLVGEEWVDFQDYFVRRQHRDPVTAFRYEGMEESIVTDEVRSAIESADVIVLVNSNPVLSILPIVSVPGMREALARSAAPCVAVTPIVGSDAVSGPAGQLMALIGQPSSAGGVAAAYRGIIGGIVIDCRDADQRESIEGMGIQVRCADTIMRTVADRERLARETLDFADELR